MMKIYYRVDKAGDVREVLVPSLWLDPNPSAA